MAKPAWPEFEQFDRVGFKKNRLRYSITHAEVSLRTQPKIYSAVIREWEKGAGGSVAEDFRRVLYNALRLCVMDKCARTIVRLREVGQKDELLAAPQPTTRYGLVGLRQARV